MRLMRVWIGLALLSASWLLGVGLYGPADFHAWIALVALGAMFLLGASASLDFPRKTPLSPWERVGVRGAKGDADLHDSAPVPASPHPNPLPKGEGDRLHMPRGAALAAAAMLLPAIYAMAWPYRVGPLLLAAGLLVAGFATRGRWLRAIASAAIASGAVLIAQGVALALYIVGTSRSHDAPWPIPQCLAAIMSLFGAETTVHGPYLVFQTMRETHRLAATWDLAFDPVTLGFLLGGLVLLGGEAWRRLPPENRGRVWRRAAAWLAAIVVCWLPVRAAVLTAVYVHRVERFPYDWPLHAMNHYFSPWVALLLLAPPALLAWRLVRLPASPPPEDAATRKEKPRATEAVAVDSTRRIAAPAVALAVVGAALWPRPPIGARSAAQGGPGESRRSPFDLVALLASLRHDRLRRGGELQLRRRLSLARPILRNVASARSGQDRRRDALWVRRAGHQDSHGPLHARRGRGRRAVRRAGRRIAVDRRSHESRSLRGLHERHDAVVRLRFSRQPVVRHGRLAVRRALRGRGHAASGRAARPLVRFRRVVFGRAGLELGAGGDSADRPVEHAARLPHEQLPPRSAALPGNARAGRSSKPGRPTTAKAA